MAHHVEGIIGMSDRIRIHAAQNGAENGGVGHRISSDAGQIKVSF
jgi:hypothetical protein